MREYHRGAVRAFVLDAVVRGRLAQLYFRSLDLPEFQR